MSAINPSEIICPSSTPHGCVFRHLVIRNSRPEDVLLKIRIDKEASRFVSFDQHTLRIPGKAVIFIKMTVYPDRVGYFVRNGYHIRGYVRLVDKTKEKELNKWLHTPGIETPRQMAFDLRLIFANKFSAPETIIDVPGLANTLEPHVGIFGVDDKDTITAVAIDADCKTAYDLNSIAEYINEVKRRASQPKTYLETAADVVTEVVKSWYEKPKKKMITDSEYINHEMNVTPCGGN